MSIDIDSLGEDDIAPLLLDILERIEGPITLGDVLCERAALLFEDDVWLTMKLEAIPLEEMTVLHINNALGTIEECGPNSIWGLAEEWVPKLYNELKRRGEI